MCKLDNEPYNYQLRCEVLMATHVGMWIGDRKCEPHEQCTKGN